MSNEFDGVGSLGLFKSISEASGLFSTGLFPQETIGAVEEFGVFHVAASIGVNGFVGVACGGMYNFKSARVETEDLGNSKVCKTVTRNVIVDGVCSVVRDGNGCEGTV
jgi:hypothetical protein